jgi:hypothetical protein
MWLWASDPAAGQAEVAVLWQAYLRRSGQEHCVRFLKSRLGWSRPLLRDPAAADRWTWLIIACCAQLWLARPSPWTPGCPGSGPSPRQGRPEPGQT